MHVQQYEFDTPETPLAVAGARSRTGFDTGVDTGSSAVVPVGEGVVDFELGVSVPRLSLIPGFDAMYDDEDDQWQERALCAQTDPEAFFPEKGGSTREAKRICMGCEVRNECLEYALSNDERFGIWGGMSERERRRLKRGII